MYTLLTNSLRSVVKVSEPVLAVSTRLLLIITT